MPGRQLIEVLEAPVIGVDHLARDVSRSRGAVERHHHARVVLAGVALDVFARGPAHEQMAGGVIGLDSHYFGLIQQHAVGNDFGFQPGGAELLRHVLCGPVVLGRGRKVRLGSECLQCFAGQFGVGHSQELFLELGFGAEVGVAQDVLRRRLRRQQAGLQPHGQNCRKEKQCKRCALAHRSGPLSGLNQLSTFAHQATGCEQWAQRRAASGMSLRHSGHGLVVGFGRGFRLL